MSDFDKSTFTDFGKLVPGFDFLQNLTRQATASAGQAQPKLPQLGHWIAPTMSVEELEKRIAELKAVQFWLDQNATALKATIQALEVQKMTLATLHGMNVNMSEMAKAFSVKMPESAASPVAAEPAEPSKGRQFSGLEVPETSYQQREPAPAPEAAEAPAAAGGVDPMQWWGALTHQFQSIAASALKEVADRHPLDAGKGMAEEAIKTATEFAESASQSFSKAANEARDFAAGKTKRKPAVKPAVKTRAKPSVKPANKTATKTATKAPFKAAAKAKAKPKAPARAPVAAARKSPTRAR
jgi:hypothetical protein